MALINYVDKTGLAFFYKQIKRKIAEAAMGIIDITSETSIPMLDDSTAVIYYIDKANTTITANNSNCRRLPTDTTGNDIFVLNQCNKSESDDVVNSYILFDEKNIYTGNVSASGVVSSWRKVSDPHEMIVEITNTQYTTLVNNDTVDSTKIYFITDGNGNLGKIMFNGIEYGGSNISISDIAVDVTQAEYDALSTAEKNNGKIYFITDASSGSSSSTTVELAERTVQDENGNNIIETYLKITDFVENEASVTEIEEQPNAGFHNSFFRGKDITSKFTDGSLYSAISAGTFEDLYVGDYFTAIINGTSITCRIAGFDCYLNQGDTNFTTHHAVIVPDEKIMDAKMNNSNTTSGGYSGSAMRTSTLESTVKGYLQSTFGNHLLTKRELVSKTVDSSEAAAYPGQTGNASDWEWKDSTVELLSEVEVYGATIWSSGGFNTGTADFQLPLFDLAPQYVNIGAFDWWLRSVVDSADFAGVNSDGDALIVGAGDSDGVRPRWLIG